MTTLRRILHALLFPHLMVLVPLVPISAILLIYAFTVRSGEGAVAYASYAVSAYTLTVLCFRSPALIRGFGKWKEENRAMRRWREDTDLRVHVSLYTALAFNTGYGIFELALGLYHRSIWFYALAAYHITLALMRALLLKDTRAKRAGTDLVREWRTYRFCGGFLLLMNMALAAIVFFVTWQNRGFEHHEITTIAMAAYTFTSLTFAIMNVFRYRKYESPVFSAAKAIGLLSSLVSMLTLETAMFTAFGGESTPAFRRLMTGMTGGGVLLFVSAIAIYMLIKANKALKQKHD